MEFWVHTKKDFDEKCYDVSLFSEWGICDNEIFFVERDSHFNPIYTVVHTYPTAKEALKGWKKFEAGLELARAGKNVHITF